MEGEEIFLVPIAFNSKLPEIHKGLPLNYTMYLKLNQLADVVSNMSLDLLEGAIGYVEFGGKPPLERVIYYRIDPDDRQRLSRLNDEYVRHLTRYPIQVKVDMHVSGQLLRPFLDFYGDWDLTAV